jgi:hypothetical protein
MEAAVYLDGWEAILGTDADLVAFLADDDGGTIGAPVVIPVAANDNWSLPLTDDRPAAVWQPRHRTVE